jgi:hypothetical protein
VTGKGKLTYAQALESEKTEKDRAEYLFCKALRKHILLKIQFSELGSFNYLHDYTYSV